MTEVKTPKLALTHMFNGQDQGYATHNGALQDLDTLGNCIGLINQTTTAPPGSPSDGDAYRIAATATGDWAGKENQIAYYHSGWRYLTVVGPVMLFDISTEVLYVAAGPTTLLTVTTS